MNVLKAYIITVFFVAFTISLVLFPAPFPYVRYDLHGFIMLIFITLTSVAAEILTAGKQSGKLQITPATYALIILYLTIVLSLLSSPDIIPSFEKILWWTLALYFMVTFHSYYNPKSFNITLIVIITCGCLAALSFITQTLIKVSNQEHLILPFALNRNFLAQILILPFFVTIFYFKQLLTKARSTSFVTSRAIPVLGASLALLLITLAIFMSRSRAVWLGIFIAGCAEVSLGAIRKKQVPLKTILAGLSGIAILLTFLHILSSYTESTSPFTTLATLLKPASGSAGGRLRRWLNALLLVREHTLLGVGPGNWLAVYPAYMDRVLADFRGAPLAFNSYLELAAESGIFALFFIVTTLLILIFGKHRDCRIVPWLRASVITLAFSAFFHNTLSVPALFVNFWLTLALLNVFSKHKAAIRLPAYITTVITALLVIGAFYQYNVLNSNLHYYLVSINPYYGKSSYRLPVPRVLTAYRSLLQDHFRAISAKPDSTSLLKIGRYGTGRMRDLYYLLGKKELFNRHYRQADFWLTHSIKRSPLNPLPARLLCKLYYDQKKYKEALSLCYKSLTLNPLLPYSHKLTADILIKTNQYETALEHYQKARNLYHRKLAVPEFGKSAAAVKAIRKKELYLTEKAIALIKNKLKTLSLTDRLLVKIARTPEIHKALTSDGLRLYFTNNSNGSYALYSIPLNEDAINRKAVQLTDQPLAFFRPQYTAKTNSIYFTTDNLGDYNYKLGRIRLSKNTTESAKIFVKAGRIAEFKISPAGSPIIAKRETRNKDILLLIDPENERATEILSSATRKEFISWSADSKKIVFVENKRKLKTLNISTGTLKELFTTTDQRILSPAYSPTGDKIVFLLRSFTGKSKIMILNLKTSKVSALFDEPDFYLTPVFYSDSLLLFRKYQQDSVLLYSYQLKERRSHMLMFKQGVIYPVYPCCKSELLLAAASPLMPIRIFKLNPLNGDYY
ncbi:MAG: hypothetical protein D6719_13610, partial [Candidatus Dadabacteria bacterium]